MSCTELGLSDYGLRLSKSSDLEITLEFASTVDFTGYDGDFAIKAELDDASRELTVNTTITANGSIMLFSENTILLRVKEDDAKTLPNATDASEPWVGWFEWTVTDPSGLKSRLFQLPLIAERGAAE